jgi:hypothetical protein
MRWRRPHDNLEPTSSGLTSGRPRVGERHGRGLRSRASGETKEAASISSGKMPDRKFNLTVRELPPFLNDGGEAALRRLV